MVEKMSRKNLAYINKDLLVWARRETPFALSPDQLSLRFPRINAEKLRKWESGEELPSIREAKDLAKIFSVSDATIVRWENDTMSPKIDYFMLICKYFNVSADYMIGIDNW